MAKNANAAPKNSLTWKHKVGYAMGDLGGCMTFALMGAYVTRYYVNVLKVDTVILATLLLIWNIWDAVNDPPDGRFDGQDVRQAPQQEGQVPSLAAAGYPAAGHHRNRLLDRAYLL